MSKQSWTWKQKSGTGNNLLYEPGNWGDILKGAWVASICDEILNEFGTDKFRYADAFAGAPEYFISRNAVIRAQNISDRFLYSVVEPYFKHGLWPSSAGIADSLVGEQSEERCLVYEADDERKALFSSSGRFSVANLSCGYEMVEGLVAGKFDGFLSGSTAASRILLIDPYDFLCDWQEQLENVVSATEVSSVLVYIYNRAAKNPERLREYRRFRSALDGLWGERPKLIGRIAADGFLPVTHHEMLYLSTGDLLGSTFEQKIFKRLNDATLLIEGDLRRSAIIES